MKGSLGHVLDINKSCDQLARERFVSSLRAYVLNDVSQQLREDYESEVAPAVEAPCDGVDVHRAMLGRGAFSRYSSLRCAAQEMVWRSVIEEVNCQAEALGAQCAQLAEAPLGSLLLEPGMTMPDYYTAVDVHLMPGNYQGTADTSLLPGAIYDNGFNVFAFGAMGEQLDDIGCSMANFVRLRFPEFTPTTIIDVGCTIGHNTLPWQQTFPDAQVYGLDLAAPCLRYAHARAEALGVPVHFRQANAEHLPFEDGSIDVVFSSMFLHEMPAPVIKRFLAEAFRVLRPGGIMLHMELPPNAALSPFDAFYLDWDGYYNNEPFYKGFRDMNYRTLCSNAGFESGDFFESVMPRYNYVDEGDFISAISGNAEFDDNTGRLSDSIQWYGFGAVRSP